MIYISYMHMMICLNNPSFRDQWPRKEPMTLHLLFA